MDLAVRPYLSLAVHLKGGDRQLFKALKIGKGGLNNAAAAIYYLIYKLLYIVSAWIILSLGKWRKMEETAWIRVSSSRLRVDIPKGNLIFRENCFANFARKIHEFL